MTGSEAEKTEKRRLNLHKRKRRQFSKMIDAINRFFGSILSAFDSFTGHYLLALFLFALMIKIIPLPFRNQAAEKFRQAGKTQAKGNGDPQQI